MDGMGKKFWYRRKYWAWQSEKPRDEIDSFVMATAKPFKEQLCLNEGGSNESSGSLLWYFFHFFLFLGPVGDRKYRSTLRIQSPCAEKVAGRSSYQDPLGKVAFFAASSLVSDSNVETRHGKRSIFHYLNTILKHFIFYLRFSFRLSYQIQMGKLGMENIQYFIYLNTI